MPQGGLEVPCTLEFKGDQVSIDKVKWVIERQKTNRETYTKRPGVKVEGDMPESTKVDITVEESQSASVNVDTLESNHEVRIEVQNSECAAVSVQLLDVMHASVSANVMESEQDKVKVKIMGTITSSSSKGGCVVEDKPVCAAEASLNHSIITTEHNYSKVETTHHVWVRFGKSFLRTFHRDEINYGRELNDQHINYAQNIIKSQFGIEGLQLTLYQNSQKPLTNQLQIIHSRKNHWITASTILSKPGYIDAY